MTSPSYDVVLCGYGPVAEVLANLLGREGYRVAVFERAESVYHMPRAAHFDHEVMRIFQGLGLAEHVVASTIGLPGMHLLTADGATLMAFDQPSGPTADSWHNDYLFYQPDLERTLRRGVDRYPNVEVFLQHEVDTITVLADGARVHVRDLISGSPDVVRADWVIGCDGARSTVRRGLGIEFEDLGLDESWLVIDVRLTTDVELPDLALQYCDPRRPATYVPMPPPYRRWEFMLLPDDDPDEIDQPDRVWELLAPWIDSSQASIVRSVVYTFHAALAQEWRRGRVALAGDAAHQMPPFLGQGMCSGIRDAANLAWKLDLILRGMAPAALLDTYQPERSPQVRTLIDRSVELGRLICTTDPVVAAERDKALLEHPELAPGAEGVALRPPLTAGAVARGTDGSVAPPAGSLFVQPTVTVVVPPTDAPGGVSAAGSRPGPGDHVLLDDVLGPGFALVVRGADPEAHVLGNAVASTAWRGVAGRVVLLVDAAAAADIAVVDGVGLVVDRDGFIGAWLDRYASDVVLVRPDRYVFGVGPTVDDASSLVLDLAGHLLGG